MKKATKIKKSIHHYKMKQLNQNQRKTYAIIDEDGKVLEYFRLKETAKNYQSEINKRFSFGDTKRRNNIQTKIVKTEDLE